MFPWVLAPLLMNDVTAPREEQQQRQASLSNCILGRGYLVCVWVVGGIVRDATIQAILLAGIIHVCQPEVIY